ncbi:hypothetical protein AHAS_Ahas14G0049300 [Arachis hypogaea]
MYNIRTCIVYMVEVWGVVEGLKMAWTMGIRKVVVECDLAATIKFLNSDKNMENHPNSLARSIFTLKKE